MNNAKLTRGFIAEKPNETVILSTEIHDRGFYINVKTDTHGGIVETQTPRATLKKTLTYISDLKAKLIKRKFVVIESDEKPHRVQFDTKTQKFKTSI